ncbi:MAG: Gfo/Idh/MocA family oxidoreductase [Bryobacterales bacterium]|nr:Gfo/Idh/MocA family oxidoreductase [Bryobacterales bacterium]
MKSNENASRAGQPGAEGAGVARRDFVPGVGAALAAFTILPRHVLGAPFRAPSDKLNLAGVGVGSMGGGYLRACESENIVALADVDFEFAAKTFARYPNARTYRDFRVMLEKEKGIDAVVIGTPDHTHAVVASAAFQLRKHVYCAKPMTRTVHESRFLAKAAREAKVATQMSTQSCASESACAVEELIQSGAIGAVREVHVWTDRPVWPQGLRRPAETAAAPSHLDWDLWLGPAPARNYHEIYHPFNWRGWYDFGTGALGDMALHTFHVVFRALKLTYPAAVSSTATFVFEPAPVGERNPEWSRGRRVVFPETFPHSQTVTWDFPARGELPPVRLHWYDGGLKPPRPADLEPGVSLRPEGSYYVGDKGALLVQGSGGGGRASGPASGLLPASRFRDFTPPPKTIPRTIGHYEEWIAAAKGGPAANCHFDFASLINETALLGVISARTGKHLLWDAQNMRFTNDEEANQYLNPPYRAGWSL